MISGKISLIDIDAHVLWYDRLLVSLDIYSYVTLLIRSWEEGKVMILDDSFEHEVWHDGNSLRLIFIVDVWHPNLTSTEKARLTPI